MIHISNLRATDVSFIIGTWNGIMGSRELLQVSRHAAESWVEELNRSGRLDSRALGSRWSPQTSLQMSVDQRGFIHAHAYPAGDNGDNPHGLEYNACRDFEDAVARMVSEDGAAPVREDLSRVKGRQRLPRDIQDLTETRDLSDEEAKRLEDWVAGK